MKKKGKLFIFVLLSAFLFVNLLNDQKLIDLDKAIENSFPGAEAPEDIIDDTEGKGSAENSTEHPGGYHGERKSHRDPGQKPGCKLWFDPLGQYGYPEGPDTTG